MPVVPFQSALIVEDSAISLARYAKLVQYPENQFWGVRNEDEFEDSACQAIWSKMQRDNVARYLAEAQFEIEELIGYFLSPRYVVGVRADAPNEDPRYVDSQNANRPGRFLTRWPHIIAAGVRASANIALAAAVNHTADPAVIGPVVTTVTDPDEVHVYHPGTDVEIDPSKITISAGSVTIEIPRCRMVTEAEADNPSTGLDYTVLGNFESTVDLKRIYTDPSTNAVLVSPHECSIGCSASNCGDHTKSACIYIRNPIIGEIDVRRSTFSGGAWRGGTLCDCPSIVRLNYLAGMRTLSRQAEDAILRLAHAKMPDEPCGCDVTQRLWKRDRFIPEVLDRERLNCPFGLSDGAYTSYMFALSMQLVRGSII